jgi:hypothetical protein
MSDVECAFCGEDISDRADQSVVCQYCQDIFCNSECFDAHLLGLPRCGGNPPQDAIDGALKRFGEEG